MRELSGKLLNKWLRNTKSFLFDIYKVFLHGQFGYACRFQPTCSCYSEEAFKKHRLFKALLLSSYRLARCHPFSRGGIDPVPERGRDING